MIEIIKKLPDNVVGIIATGRVTNDECNNILRPAMEASLGRHDKIRLYYEIGSRFPGAGWDNLNIGARTLQQLERIAVVTDTGWVRQTVNALRFLIASEVRVYTRLNAEEGWAWITSPSDGAVTPHGEAIVPTQAPWRRPRASPRRSRWRYQHSAAGDRVIPLT